MSLKSRKLKLSYDGGIVNGRQRTISKTYNNLSHGASDSAIKQVGQTIVGLQTRPLNEMLKIDETIL